MRNESKNFMSSFTFWFKTILSLYLLFMYIYAYIGMHYLPTKKKVVGSINEWLSLYILIFWVFSLTEDWPNVHVEMDMEEMVMKVVVDK